jgi:site-specific DNA-methyltransferase (adenine-specific)
MLKICLNDCLTFIKTMDDNSVDSIVTDPPYGLSFMGKKWDYDVPSVEVWQECLRVLKPGGHLLAFAGTRTQHRMATAIEDAGFEIRDMIAWVYGSGFPKSLDVSKAIDKAAGAEREVVGVKVSRQPTGNAYAQDEWTKQHSLPQEIDITAPATEAAQQWAGWGTALKPSLEPITVARKPLCGTVAANVLRHGTGGLNVDGCRVGTEERPRLEAGFVRNGRTDEEVFATGYGRPKEVNGSVSGRWPANLIHDGSDEVVGLLNEASRFFYCAKANKKDRGENNNHPTVKPTDLMRYLCRLVTPSKGIVLDPFMGSGSTGKACVLEGFDFIGIEKSKEFIAIAKRRIMEAKKGKK